MTILKAIEQDLTTINSIQIPIGLMDQIGTPLKKVAADLLQIKLAFEQAAKKEAEKANTAAGSAESATEEPAEETE